MACIKTFYKTLLFLQLLLYVVTLTQDEITKKFAEIIKKQVLQENALKVLQRTTTRNSAYCKLLRADICGPCACYDDYGLKKRYYCDCQELAPKRDCLEFYQSGIFLTLLFVLL